MSTRDKLLAGFNGKAGQVISGETLARRLGLSRTAIWKQLQSLKLAGIPIESLGRRGYRLTVPFDNSLIRFRAPAWVTPHYYLTTGSTQTLAKAGAAAGLPQGHLWIAETQTKGRGRLDRHWESSYGGLWFSLLMRPQMPASRVPPITLVAGLSLAQAVEKVSGIQVKLKWPNDLVIQGKKLAGILTEMSGQVDRTDWVVIGVGLNVNNSLSPAMTDIAATLREKTGQPASRASFLEAFLKSFHAAYVRYAEQGFEPFRRAYWAAYFGPDQSVRLKTAQGVISGIARGVDASGAIMLESDTHRSDARRVASRRRMLSISEGEIIK